MNQEFLRQILERKWLEVKERKKKKPLSDLLSQLKEKSGDRRGQFSKAIRRLTGERLKLIAEIKRASPSRGLLRSDFKPVDIALIYEKSGASAISVLTDEFFFQGSLEFLKEVSRAVALPALCKDFIVDPYQLAEAKLSGARAVLLIVAALDKKILMTLENSAREIGLETLIEVHDEKEIEIAMECHAEIIGINNRDLKSFRVDLSQSERLVQKIPKSIIRVAESGISSAREMKRLSECGFDAVLVGETFMKEPDIENKVKELMSYEC